MTRWPNAVCALLALLLVQVGCSSSVLQLRDQLDLHRGEFRQKFDDKKELVTKFLACTRQAHDEPLNERRAPSASPDSLLQQSGGSSNQRPPSDVPH